MFEFCMLDSDSVVSAELLKIICNIHVFAKKNPKPPGNCISAVR